MDKRREKMTTKFKHIIPHKEKWNQIHDCKSNEYLSVTKFIQFIGEGYGSRNQMFDPKQKEREQRNDYLQWMFKHGSKNEGNAKKFLNEYGWVCWKDSILKEMCITRGRLLGTLDGVVIHPDTNEEMILEIKCPMKQDGDSVLDKTPCFRHWLQLQLYLWIIGYDYGIERGCLVYYYPHGGPNGEQVAKLFVFSKVDETILERELNIECELQKYFIDYQKRTTYKPERIKKQDYKLLKEQFFLKGIVQTTLLQESEIETMEHMLCVQEECP